MSFGRCADRQTGGAAGGWSESCFISHAVSRIRVEERGRFTNHFPHFPFADNKRWLVPEVAMYHQKIVSMVWRYNSRTLPNSPGPSRSLPHVWPVVQLGAESMREPKCDISSIIEFDGYRDQIRSEWLAMGGTLWNRNQDGT